MSCICAVGTSALGPLVPLVLWPREGFRFMPELWAPSGFCPRFQPGSAAPGAAGRDVQVEASCLFPNTAESIVLMCSMPFKVV